MSSIERELNAYLFYELGFDDETDESRVSDSWPFRLRRITTIGDDPVFEFEDDQPYFAVVTGGLNFFPKAGMEVGDLPLQFNGSRWIAARVPVSLELSMPGDPAVPSGLERRRELESLGSLVLPGRAVEILEGLFLKSEHRYVGLFQANGESEAVIGGLPRVISVPFPKAAAWRRLAWGVGRWLHDQGESSSP